jgi:hypothetical protein
MATLSFVDESTAGERSAAWPMEIFEERLTLREIIRKRIFQEVAEYHARAAGPVRGLVQPAGVGAPGPAGRGHGRRVDAQRQYEIAVTAFRRNGFVVLVDERQVEDLDEVVDLFAGSVVTFLKLVPLVGG